jgi:hypothetical protein
MDKQDPYPFRTSRSLILSRHQQLLYILPRPWTIPFLEVIHFAILASCLVLPFSRNGDITRINR